jgi:PhzF family phenazine biosynthesis protein
MSPFKFTQVDVFTDQPLKGNPLAVVHGADSLSDAQMQALARWTNLSETSFLLRPTDPAADYRVRIFTPHMELKFAGHPTLGSCHAWLEAGGVPKGGEEIIQQCGVGLVTVARRGGNLAFAAPPLRREPVADATLEKALVAIGLPRSAVLRSQWLINGSNWWLAIMLRSAELVLDLRPDAGALDALARSSIDAQHRIDQWGLIAPHAESGDAVHEVRALIVSESGLYEDPVTGSLNAALAQWLMDEKAVPERYRATQGTALGRDGRVLLERVGDVLWVGGASVSCVRGELTL